MTGSMAPNLPPGHILIHHPVDAGMKASTWTLAPARLAPASLDPRPVQNDNSPGFPKTVDAARAYALEIKGDRAKRLPWRKIAEKPFIARIEAIRLTHSLDQVLDEIRTPDSSGGASQDVVTEARQ